jgi:Neurolysin/Thimet oligopeptidase, N-terminal domain
MCSAAHVFCCICAGIRAGPAWDKLSEAQRRVVEIELRDFVLGGVALEGAARERYNAIQQELAQISTKFSNNVLDATKASTGLASFTRLQSLLSFCLCWLFTHCPVLFSASFGCSLSAPPALSSSTTTTQTPRPTRS